MSNFVEVAGATAQQGNDVTGSEIYKQTRRVLEKIDEALAVAGSSFEEVGCTRLFVADISQWEAVGRAHGEVFGSFRLTTSMLEVRALIDPRLLVEIEATAIISA